MNKSSVKVAVVQAAPILFKKNATVKKACQLINQASENGAEFILFPEAFIPAYPRGLSFGTVVGSRSCMGRDLWKRYWQNSVKVPGPVTEELGKAARKNGVYLAIGIIEKDITTKGTLYCSLLYIDPEGEVSGVHRKLKPTGSERIIWGEGDGNTLIVIDTEIGKMGGLICWENYMPLARMTIYRKGVEIYLAPTADSRETWQSTMKHIACEGRCFVLGCNQFVTRDMYPEDINFKEEIEEQPEIMCRGGSVIISPMGKVLAGPLYDEEGILYSEIDLEQIVRGKFDFDVTGHYSRPDVFNLTVNEAGS